MYLMYRTTLHTVGVGVALAAILLMSFASPADAAAPAGGRDAAAARPPLPRQGGLPRPPRQAGLAHPLPLRLSRGPRAGRKAMIVHSNASSEANK